jgi:hypothetical protein
MAKSGTFQSKQNVNVIIADEATVGTAAAVDATRIVMPVTDFTFSDAFKHSLSVAPSRVGKGGMTQSDDMVKWQRHDVMWDISITFHATAQSVDRVCKALFGDGDGANVLLGSMPSVTAYSHGTSNTTPVTLFFENSSHDGDTVDMHFTSCIATSLSMSGDISSNGGVVMCTATFQTAYKPTEAALNFSGGSETAISAQATMFNMHDLQTTSLDGEDLLLYAFDVNIARPVNRIGFDASNDFRPMGYGVGAYEVTGNLTCKRDGEVDDAINNSAGMALDLDTTVFQIVGDKVFVDEAGISFDDDGWKQTIPLRFTYDSAATTNDVITINTVA